MTTDPSEWRARLRERLRALTSTGRYRDARDAVRAEVARIELEAGGGPPLATALVELAGLEDALGDNPAAEKTILRAEASAAGPQLDRDLLAEALARHAALRRFAGALDESEAMLTRAREVLGPQPDHGRGAAWALAESALSSIDRGDEAEASAFLVRSRSAAERLPVGPDGDDARLVVLAAPITVHRTRGRYAEAQAAAADALAFAELSFGPSSLEVAAILNEVGMIGKFSGRFEEAEAAYRRALVILEGVLGAEHRDVASLYHNVGGLRHARGDYAAAEPHARRSVAIHERVLGPDHPMTALDRAAHAAILDGLGRSDEAEAILRGAIESLSRVLGEDHHEVAAAMNNLAAIVQRRGDLDEAEALYRHALASKERALGARSPGLAITLNNLGTVLRRRGRLAEAATAYRRALAILEAAVEPDHPSIAATRDNLAALERARGGHAGRTDAEHGG